MCKKTTYTFFFLAVLLVFSVNGKAQDVEYLQFDKYTTEHFVQEKGLSQNSIFSIYQDEIGFMWFGTWDGLNRYDGYSFISFSAFTDDGKPSLGKNESINDIVEDKNNNLWIATNSGLIMFERKTQEYYLYANTPKRRVFSSNNLNCLAFDLEDNLWIGTDKGINRFNPFENENKIFKADFSDPDAISSNIINDIKLDEKGNLWIATNFGLNYYVQEEMRFEKFFSADGFSGDSIYSIELLSNDRIWVGTSMGLDFFDYAKKQIQPFHYQGYKPLYNVEITAIKQDNKANLWIGTAENGLYLYSQKEKSLVHYEHKPGNQRSISSNAISEIFQDRTGDIWIGTNVGLNRVNYQRTKFRHYNTNFGLGNSFLSDNMVWTIQEVEDQKLWVGTNRGIDVVDLKQKKIASMNTANSFLISNNIRHFYTDSKNNIWIGTYDRGVMKYNPSDKSLRLLNTKTNPEITSNTVWGVLEDSKGMIWIATDDGLNLYDEVKNKMYFFFHDPMLPGTLPGNKIMSVYEDRQNVSWIATFSGMARYDRSKNVFVSYQHSPNDQNSISNDRVFSFYEDSRGNFWIATMGGGLNKFNRKLGKFTRYAENTGIANNVVYHIREDKDGFLWLTTNYGLSKFNVEKELFINYDIKDGLQAYEYNFGAFAVLSSGEFVVGGTNGINIFIPEEIIDKSHLPPLAITSFKVLNKKVSDYLINEDTIYLKHFENFFSFEFAALDYTNSYRNKYAYILEGVDRQWVEVDASRRKAEYTNIRPGSYNFKVRLLDSDGNWSSKYLRITIIIKPPWYETLLFRILFVSLVVFLIWRFVQFRINKERKIHHEKQRILELQNQMHSLEQQALRLQMNPHFIFNSLNSIQSFVIENDTDKAINYLAKFSQLMRLILSSSREIYVPLEDEIKSLSYYLEIERLRFDSKFDYIINVEETIDKEFTEIPPMVIQPYVENAIIHGLLNKKDKGFLSINFFVENAYLKCIVTDNGVGRENAMELKQKSGLQRKSRGMLITQQRLEMLNKQTKQQLSVKIEDLFDENNIASGTRVTIYMPFIEE